ncbi:MAG: hypothetical protein K6G83_06025, partial [Lachnospiraceae bacterium]|nr:hypothetical protein [Lachnospiraceae bacterium]
SRRAPAAQRFDKEQSCMVLLLFIKALRRGSTASSNALSAYYSTIASEIPCRNNGFYLRLISLPLYLAYTGFFCYTLRNYE